jgi:hypothetical protein
MGLMARAARMAARQGREAISEDDIYAAMENKAMEAYAVSNNSSCIAHSAPLCVGHAAGKLAGPSASCSAL